MIHSCLTRTSLKCCCLSMRTKPAFLPRRDKKQARVPNKTDVCPLAQAGSRREHRDRGEEGKNSGITHSLLHPAVLNEPCVLRGDSVFSTNCQLFLQILSTIISAKSRVQQPFRQPPLMSHEGPISDRLHHVGLSDNTLFPCNVTKSSLTDRANTAPAVPLKHPGCASRSRLLTD